MLAKKIDSLLRYDIIPIYCVGEVLEERENGTHFDVIRKQIEEALFHLKAADFENVIIAYEPVWAIGTRISNSETGSRHSERSTV